MFIEESSMTDKKPISVDMREAERREIEEQIQAFLNKGGKIEQIPLPAGAYRHVGKAGQSGYSGLDGF